MFQNAHGINDVVGSGRIDQPPGVPEFQTGASPGPAAETSPYFPYGHDIERADVRHEKIDVISTGEIKAEEFRASDVENTEGALIAAALLGESGDRPFHEMIFGEAGVAVDRLENPRNGLPKAGSESVSEEAGHPGGEAETVESDFLILHGRDRDDRPGRPSATTHP